jgi:hypothetical protein
LRLCSGSESGSRGKQQGGGNKCFHGKYILNGKI